MREVYINHQTWKDLTDARNPDSSWQVGRIILNLDGTVSDLEGIMSQLDRAVAAKVRIANGEDFPEMNKRYKALFPKGTEHFPVREPAITKNRPDRFEPKEHFALADFLIAPIDAELKYMNASSPDVPELVKNKALPGLFGPYSYKVEAVEPDGTGVFFTAAECGDISKDIAAQQVETISYLLRIATYKKTGDKRDRIITHHDILYSKPEVLSLLGSKISDPKRIFDKVPVELNGIPFFISAAGVIEPKS